MSASVPKFSGRGRAPFSTRTLMSVSQGRSLAGVSTTRRSVFSYGPSCARSVITGRDALNATGLPFASSLMKGRMVFMSTGKLNVTTTCLHASGTTSSPDGETETSCSGSVRNVNVVSPVSASPCRECRDGLTLNVYSVAGASWPFGSKARRRDPYQR